MTTDALRRLAGHPGLKTLNLSGPPRPLARRQALESIDFFPEDGPSPGDDESVGLDRIAGRRRLKGWTGRFTEPTLARVGRLGRLRHLILCLGVLRGDDSLRHLAGLRELERLPLATATPFTDA